MKKRQIVGSRQTWRSDNATNMAGRGTDIKLDGSKSSRRS